MMRKNIVVCDLDGTLLNSEGELSTQTENYFIDFIKAGNIFVIATGRSIYGAQSIIEKLNLKKFSGYVITDNGASLHIAYDNKLCLLEETFISHKTVELILSYAFKYFKDIYFYNNEALCKYKNIEQTYKVNETNYVTSDGGETKRIFIYAEKEEIEKKILFLRNEFINEDVNIYHSMDNMIEITPKSCSKGSALLNLSKYANLNLDKAYAFGDSENDISMLNIVGNPVKMKNCVGKMKLEKFESCQSNNENGLVNYLKSKHITN